MMQMCDLPAHAFLDRGLDLVELRETRLLHLAQVTGHQVGDGKRPRTLLQRFLKPGGLQEGRYSSLLLLAGGAAIQVGGRPAVDGTAIFVEPDKLEPLGDRLRLAVPRRSTVADGMAQRDQDPGSVVPVSLINQYRATCQEVPIPLKRQVDE